MLDNIKHECGIALIRFKKPYYEYNDYASQTLAKMFLLMEKQINRGQDGAGVVNLKINTKPGIPYIHRLKSVASNPLVDIFSRIKKRQANVKKKFPEKYNDINWRIENSPFSGQLWLGHLRYGTFGTNGIDSCHPFYRKNNWRSKSLLLAGNFNMTNVDELFNKLVSLGQHPKEKIDTVTVMEKIGHFLDEEIQRIFYYYKNEVESRQELSHIIENELQLNNVLTPSCKDFDGGYVIAGVLGYGAGFVIRDPNGIRPVYYYEDDEILVVASEKPPINAAFDINYDKIKAIPPGAALIFDQHGNGKITQVLKSENHKSCSFERIYFSRSTDPEIYNERKKLGKKLLPQLLNFVGDDLNNTVFSYIPNTAEISFLGLIESINEHIFAMIENNEINTEEGQKKIKKLLKYKPRIEKIVYKDAKMRTFITNDKYRNNLVSHAYDTTYGTIKTGVDNLVVIDDSIVRGTTLKNKIITLLDKLEPKRIIVISSAPQIRYPDCYGIDMSNISDLVAFKAAIALLEETGQEEIIYKVYEKCVEDVNNPNPKNHVREIYEPFDPITISKKIAQLVKAKYTNAEIVIIYQTIEALKEAINNHDGDWYFTGNYPTPGGRRIVNKAFINYFKKLNVRAY